MTHANSTALPRKIHNIADLGRCLGFSLILVIAANFHTHGIDRNNNLWVLQHFATYDELFVCSLRPKELHFCTSALLLVVSSIHQSTTMNICHTGVQVPRLTRGLVVLYDRCNRTTCVGDSGNTGYRHSIRNTVPVPIIVPRYKYTCIRT